MANYNPYMPQILGQEWCPIREEDLSLAMNSPNQAFGQHIELSAAAALNEMRWYTRDYPSSMIHIPITAEVYPAGYEDLTGPIQRVLIPCNNGTTTGSDVTVVGGSAAIALWNPSDFNYINLATKNTYSTNPAFTAYFAGSTYSPLLQGKRILGINVLYTAHMGFSLEDLDRQAAGDGTTTMRLWSNTDSVLLAFSDWDQREFNSLPFDNDVEIGDSPPNSYYRVPLGLANPFWSSATQQANEFAPWIPGDLARFESSASAATRLGITIASSAPSAPTAGFSGNFTWEYMALEVFYCTENRVAVGMAIPAGDTLIASQRTAMSTNRVVLRHPVTRATTPSVGPGNFTTLIYSPEIPPAFTNGYEVQGSSNADIESLRQLYSIPTLAGTRVRMPFPYDPDVVGQEFEAESSNILPHLTLHTTTAVVVDSHAYGRQARAEVYGSVTATQEILDSVTGGARSYPQVRYYARRWGDTTVPLILDSPSIAGSSVTLTPNAFDELEEILDGWKEVTLRFDTAPSMGAGTNPQWRWSATGENSANRWEVLGAGAPALSGIPGSNFALSNQSLAAATYGMPISGAQVNLGWVPGFAPMVTATTDDTTSDAVILFSTDPPTPTGLMVSPLSQALAFTDPDCPTDPACIPSELFYNQLAWTATTGASLDSFGRVAASGWGSTELGQDWIEAGIAAHFSVNGSQGVHAHAAGASETLTATVDVGSPDVEASVQFTVDALDTAGMFEVQLHARKTDDNNLYRAMVTISTTQTMTLAIGEIVASAVGTLATYTVPDLMHNVTGVYNLKFRVAGTRQYAKLWEDSQPEPDTWQITTIDTSLLTGNQVALRSVNNSAAGVAINALFDNFYVQPAEFGALELQRYDPVDAEFSTIMLATNAAITGFSDFEARVGQNSVYRLRERNVYDFAGLWSTQVTGAVASPGVVGGDVALLLFTSNFRQDGSVNLAYSSEWEGDPEEQFNWPEAQQVTLQAMYRKNFPTAFRPLERGGETFVRDILVNAAGIPEVVSQNGFKSLRDMAWDTVPYVCVRDELGNRWYSTVVVPQGSRKRMVNKGHLNVAQIQVVEVTEAPYPVNPS